MNVKVIGSIILIALGFALIGYVALGGFKEIKISKASFSGYILAGFPYKGKATDRDFNHLFEMVRNDHMNGKVQGTLAAVYYDTPQADKGKVDAFIGLIVKDSSNTLPDTYKYTSVRGRELVRAIINSHPAVAPAPDKMKNRLMDYAWENKLKLHALVIEKYVDDRNIVIEIPVLAK